MSNPGVKKRPRSLAFRVTLLVGVTIFICFGLMSLIVFHSIEQHFAEQDADELNEVFEAVQSKLVEAHENGILPSSILPQAVSGHHGVYYHVTRTDGKVVFSSQEADLSFFPQDLGPFEQVTQSNLFMFNDAANKLRGTKLSVKVPTPNYKQKYLVIVASNMDFHLAYMDKLQKTLWGIMLCSAIITIIAARIAIYRGHSPLRHLSRKMESITADKLDIRLNPNDVPVELSALVISFNTMIKRLEEGFERLSHFSADIAHELRTPITNLTTQTQVMLSKQRNSEQYAEILYSNLEEYERMTNLVSDMLLLAQTDHGLVQPQVDLINVKEEIYVLIEYFGILAEDKNIQLELFGPDLEINCDKSMFKQALSNLIANAIHYSPKNERIVLETNVENKQKQISVKNRGEKISAEHIPKLFDRFYRTDPSRQRDGQGAGLGLTIAKSIIKINGGDIIVHSSDQETTFTIVFNS
tara:strand:- start:3249 stop:4655 length:1407 start_codon:yes stop_codon:yes gene_type:complete